MEVVVSFSQIAHFFSGVSTLFLIILPILALAVLVEMALRLVLKRGYPDKHSLVSFAVGVGHVLTQAVTYGIIIGVIGEAAYHFRLFTVHFSWSDVPLVLALFIACDFFFTGNIARHIESASSGQPTACTTPPKTWSFQPQFDLAGRPCSLGFSSSIFPSCC